MTEVLATTAETAAREAPEPRLPRSVWIVLGAFALALLVFTKARPGSWADGSRLGTVQALVEHGTLALDETDFLWQGDKVVFEGHFYSHQPPMLALVAAVPYAVLHHGLGVDIEAPPAASELGPAGSMRRAPVFTAYRLLTWCVTGLPLWLGFWALAHLLVQAGTPRRWLAPLLGLAAFGTLALPYGLVLNQHGTAAGLVLLAFLAVDRGRAATAGALLALATTIDLTAVFPALFAAWPLLRAGGARAVVRYGLGALPALALHFSVNRAVAGDLLPFGLHTEAFRYSLSPFLLMALTGGDASGELAGTQGAYAFGALLGRSGLFSHSPWLLLTVIAGLALTRVPAEQRRATLRLAPGLLTTVALSALAIATYYVTQSRNFGGSSFGMRWFTVFSPSLALFAGAWLGTRPGGWRAGPGLLAATTFLGIWSVAAACLGAVQPWMKFAYTWEQTPEAVLATAETPRPTTTKHLEAEWARVWNWRQPFDADYWVLWYSKILNQHGQVRTKRWPGFTEAEQEAWVREGLVKLHVVSDEMAKANDRSIARATAHFWLGKFHKRLGEDAEARKEFVTALGVYPGYTAAKRALESLDAGE